MTDIYGAQIICTNSSRIQVLDIVIDSNLRSEKIEAISPSSKQTAIKIHFKEWDSDNCALTNKLKSIVADYCFFMAPDEVVFYNFAKSAGSLLPDLINQIPQRNPTILFHDCFISGEMLAFAKANFWTENSHSDCGFVNCEFADNSCGVAEISKKITAGGSLSLINCRFNDGLLGQLEPDLIGDLRGVVGFNVQVIKTFAGGLRVVICDDLIELDNFRKSSSVTLLLVSQLGALLCGNDQIKRVVLRKCDSSVEPILQSIGRSTGNNMATLFCSDCQFVDIATLMTGFIDRNLFLRRIVLRRCGLQAEARSQIVQVLELCPLLEEVQLDGLGVDEINRIRQIVLHRFRFVDKSTQNRTAVCNKVVLRLIEEMAKVDVTCSVEMATIISYNLPTFSALTAEQQVIVMTFLRKQLGGKSINFTAIDGVLKWLFDVRHNDQSDALVAVMEGFAKQYWQHIFRHKGVDIANSSGAMVIDWLFEYARNRQLDWLRDSERSLLDVMVVLIKQDRGEQLTNEDEAILARLELEQSEAILESLPRQIARLFYIQFFEKFIDNLTVRSQIMPRSASPELFQLQVQVPICGKLQIPDLTKLSPYEVKMVAKCSVSSGVWNKISKYAQHNTVALVVRLLRAHMVGDDFDIDDCSRVEFSLLSVLVKANPQELTVALADVELIAKFKFATKECVYLLTKLTNLVRLTVDLFHGFDNKPEMILQAYRLLGDLIIIQLCSRQDMRAFLQRIDLFVRQATLHTPHYHEIVSRWERFCVPDSYKQMFLEVTQEAANGYYMSPTAAPY